MAQEGQMGEFLVNELVYMSGIFYGAWMVFQSGGGGFFCRVTDRPTKLEEICDLFVIVIN